MASQAEKQFITGKPVRIPAALREELEAAIRAHLTAVEKLTAVLDKADGDPDLEPSLGHYPYGAPVALLDCEGDEHDGREPDGDIEPSLAHTNGINQERTARSGSWLEDDVEAEHDGREPD